MQPALRERQCGAGGAVAARTPAVGDVHLFRRQFGRRYARRRQVARARDVALRPRRVAAGVQQDERGIVEELLRDGRTGYAELGRAVGLSASAVTERVRRLEESGVITGYVCEVDAEKLGLPIAALVRLRYPNANYRPFHQLLDTTPEIVEAHHVTGEDCFVLTVRARSMRHLEEVTGRISGLGAVTTSVVYSSPLTGRALAAGAASTEA